MTWNWEDVLHFCQVRKSKIHSVRLEDWFSPSRFLNSKSNSYGVSDTADTRTLAGIQGGSKPRIVAMGSVSGSTTD